jgi:hypothetical protein
MLPPKGFKPVKLTGEPAPTVGDGHQDRRASDRIAARKTQRSKTVGLFATFTRGHVPPDFRVPVGAENQNGCPQGNTLSVRNSFPAN